MYCCLGQVQKRLQNSKTLIGSNQTILTPNLLVHRGTDIVLD